MLTNTTSHSRNDRSKTAWCPFCKKAISAKTGYEMIRHLTTHLGDRSKFPYKCPLPMCNQRTLRLNCIKKHVATHGVEWTEDMVSSPPNHGRMNTRS